MDTATPKQPPVMRPMQFGEASSHLTHRPAALPSKRNAWGLQKGQRIGGIGSPKVL